MQQEQHTHDNSCNHQTSSNNNIQNYLPIVLSGCSGVGKGTLVKYLLSKFPNLFQLSISLTTRKPRQGEQNGREYYFVSKQQFEEEIKKDSFAEYCKVHDNYYGTHGDQLQNIIKKGKVCILEIDLQGGQKIYKKRPNYKFLFIAPPSIQTLEVRLRHRGTENEETIVKRMKNARVELQEIKRLRFYDTIINNDLQIAQRELLCYVKLAYGLNL